MENNDNAINIWKNIYEEINRIYDSSLNSAILDKLVFKEIINNDTIVLSSPDQLTSGWFYDNYKNLAEEISNNLYKKKYNFKIIVESSKPNNEAYPTYHKNIKKSNENTYLNLNPKYTFERFIVGQNNDFAHAAALQVANHPAKSYNPLFIYGDVALGKTHLLQAIAHKIIKEKPDLKVCYTSSEKFTNEFIEALSNKDPNKFRKKYRSFDVLIIDDIQFFQEKEHTLQELFHTFNELFHERKQMVFACDRPAKSLTAVEDRLRTRFDSGLSVKIEHPNFETRKAILLARIAEQNVYIPDEVVDYIAHNIENDIRLLEGSLTKVIAYSDLKKKEISLDLAKEILRDKIKVDVPKNITVSDIQKVVSKYFNISINDLKSDRRLENITYARHIAMYLAKEYTNHSLAEIGELFGGKAHTTVMRSAEKVSQLIKKRIKAKKEIDEIIASFYNIKKEDE